MPEYGQVADPYSEIGFPMQYNPYMQKKAAKRWRKQQKYMAKYGQFGMGGGGFYANDIEEDYFDHDDDEEAFDTGFSHIEFNDGEDG